MAERWTTAQVAEWCNIKASTYRDYVSEGRAPGPLSERDPDTGAKLYDADAVKAWHAARPGPGARTDLGQRGADVGQTRVGTRPEMSVPPVPETPGDQQQCPSVSGPVGH